MKKQFLNLGKALNKAEQKQVNGGKATPPDEYCYTPIDLGDGIYCDRNFRYDYERNLCCANL